MIVDFLYHFDINDQKRIIEMSDRWHAYKYRRNTTAFDLYEKFPNAPYYSYRSGICFEPDCREENHYDCKDYVDPAYESWFDKLLIEEEIEELEDFEKLVQRQRKALQDDSQWDELHSNITLKLLNWLNEKEVTYCLIRNIPGQRDYLFAKNFLFYTEYRLLFSGENLSTYEIDYAITKLSWKQYYLSDLTGISDMKQKRIIEDWMYENKVGIIRKLNSDSFLFENDIDAMAVKLRWNEYNNV